MKMNDKSDAFCVLPPQIMVFVKFVSILIVLSRVSICCILMGRECRLPCFIKYHQFKNPLVFFPSSPQICFWVAWDGPVSLISSWVTLMIYSKWEVKVGTINTAIFFFVRERKPSLTFYPGYLRQLSWQNPRLSSKTRESQECQKWKPEGLRE